MLRLLDSNQIIRWIAVDQFVVRINSRERRLLIHHKFKRAFFLRDPLFVQIRPLLPLSGTSEKNSRDWLDAATRQFIPNNEELYPKDASIRKVWK